MQASGNSICLEGLLCWWWRGRRRLLVTLRLAGVAHLAVLVDKVVAGKLAAAAFARVVLDVHVEQLGARHLVLEIGCQLEHVVGHGVDVSSGVLLVAVLALERVVAVQTLVGRLTARVFATLLRFALQTGNGFIDCYLKEAPLTKKRLDQNLLLFFP